MPILRKDFDKAREYSTGANLNDLHDGEDIGQKLGKASLLANRECIKYNYGSYTTDATGYTIDVETGLDPTSPTKLRFSNEKIKIDKADFLTDWQFQCGLEGVYQVNLGLEMLMSSASGTAIEDYIQNQGNRKIYLYRNDVQIIPFITGFNNMQYQTTNNDNYYTHDGVYYHNYVNGSDIIDLQAGDKLDVRIGYLSTTPTSAITMTIKGYISLFWINQGK